jgi:hypothetical protein
MTQSRRKRLDDELIREFEKLDDRLARKWLKNHSPKQASKPKQKSQPLERWQIRRQEQQQERRALARPLLKGVE